MRYKVSKVNGRLVITDSGLIAYYMPYWIRINSRQDLQRLADLFNLNGEPNIIDIIEFETRYSNKPY